MYKIKKSVHFIGIGGIGVSSLARWFLAEKWAVSGSDASPSNNNLLKDLGKDGVKVKIGHKKGHITPKIGLVIYSQAVDKAKNPEAVQARRLGIPLLSYPQTVGLLTQMYKTVAVSGAHGKSTTTALASLVLKEGGLDPTVIIGTKLREFGGKNFRRGSGKYLVLEADEWKASFLNYSPTLAVITNIDKEHLDFYKNFSSVKKTFLKFVSGIKRGG
ncbi:MAG: Mur ligase domain-containing protein, partial [Patescibacteria group bacterium]